MKKYINSMFILALGLLTFGACAEEEGLEPGNDTAPNVVLYQSSPESPYDPDLDVKVRVVANNQTSSVYYLSETDEAKKAHELTDDAYAEYVVKNGKQVELTKAEDGVGRYTDVVVNCQGGANVVTFVAVGGGKRTVRAFDFYGVSWTTLAKGTYHFNAKVVDLMTSETVETEFQQCGDDANLFRFRNIYGAGQHLQLVKTEWKGEDEDGPYTFYRVAAQPTNAAYGSYGTILVRDLGYWQNDDSYAQTLGYGVTIWDNDYYGYLVLQYHVAAGNLGYGGDEFVPAE